MRMTSEDAWVSVETLGDEDVKVWVHPSHAEEIRRDLEEAGLEPLLYEEKSAFSEGVMWAVSVGAGGFSAIVVALRAYWHRHDSKELTIEDRHGDKVTVKGMSPDASERIVRAMRDDQAHYREVMREFDEAWAKDDEPKS